jgi:hypothetical protein
MNTLWQSTTSMGVSNTMATSMTTSMTTSTPSSRCIQIGHALSSHKNYGKALAHNLSELWRILLECATSPNTGEVVCVLDALDECEASSRNQLINKLKEFYCDPSVQSKSPKLKFLVTSRPYSDLENYFAGFDTASCLHFDGDESQPTSARRSTWLSRSP